MAITAAERDVLLKRLELARIAKIKKQEDAKAAKAAKTESAPAPAPAPEPTPAPPVPEPIQSPPRSEPIDIPVVPDLVAASKKKPAKKVCLPVSDDESDEEVAMPKKKKTVKKDVPYMKIKLYKEPRDPEAFKSLLENINNPPEYEDEVPPAPEPEPAPFVRPPRVLHNNNKPLVRPMVGGDRKMEEARQMALAFFS